MEKWEEEDAWQCKKDTDSANSAKKAGEVKFVESLDPADVVKLRTSKKEPSAEESTRDGESLGWDINLNEESFVDKWDGEPPKEFEELPDVETSSEEDSWNVEEWWEWESSEEEDSSDDEDWWEEDLSIEEESSEEDSWEDKDSQEEDSWWEEELSNVERLCWQEEQKWEEWESLEPND